MINPNKTIFVFGSNLAGIHGAGAALYAKYQLEAEQGIGIGLTGKCYAIPTKDRNIESMTVKCIEYYVDHFIDFVYNTPQYDYKITQIGCGLAGNDQSIMADLFRHGMYGNCYYDTAWRDYLPKNAQFWGTY